MLWRIEGKLYCISLTMRSNWKCGWKTRPCGSTDSNFRNYLIEMDVKTIGKHINNALKEELAGIATVANFATVQKEGDRTVIRHLEYYNLEMILSVGYRVKSSRGIEFRRWANSVLKEYLLKGYSVNRRLTELEHTVAEHSRKIDFFVRTFSSAHPCRLLKVFSMTDKYSTPTSSPPI